MTQTQKATIAKLEQYKAILKKGGIRTQEANECLKSIKEPVQDITLEELETREVPPGILDGYDYEVKSKDGYIYLVD
jgi:hypothetical protein